MNDRHVRDKLSEYIDGMLSQEEASAVKEHLDRCPDCLEEYEETVKIIGHMNQMESLETPEFFVEKVHERIEKSKSLKRLVKRLFYPLRIKIPLELAGVAAAALLVIYIVGIQGKQHVYELAYAQRSQPLTVLQEQKMERGAVLEEAITVSKKAQPALELQDEKMKKKDKRAVAEEAAPPGTKEPPAFAPQEKKLDKGERRVGAKEEILRSKMVQETREPDFAHKDEQIERKAQIKADTPSVAKGQKREDLSLEVADKEEGEAEKDALQKPILREKSLEDIVDALGGKIIELEYNENTQVLESLILEIPAEKYQKLIQALEEQGDIRKPYPAIKEKSQEIITIRLILQQ
jgi:hypothetical protein